MPGLFLHRDVKPLNIMLCEKGGVYDVVKALDFGLVKVVDARGTRDDVVTSRSSERRVESFTRTTARIDRGARAPRSVKSRVPPDRVSRLVRWRDHKLWFVADHASHCRVDQ